MPSLKARVVAATFEDLAKPSSNEIVPHPFLSESRITVPVSYTHLTLPTTERV